LFLVVVFLFNGFSQAITVHICVPKFILKNKKTLKPSSTKGHRKKRCDLVRKSAKKSDYWHTWHTVCNTPVFG